MKLEVLVVHTFQRNVACSRIMSRKDVGGIWHLARLMGGQGNRLHWSRDKAMPTFRCVSLSLVLCLQYFLYAMAVIFCSYDILLQLYLSRVELT